jgi:hypothetical protein
MLAWTCSSANTAARFSEQRETATDHHLYEHWRSWALAIMGIGDPIDGRDVLTLINLSRALLRELRAPSHKSHNRPQIHLPAHWRNVAA